MKYKLSDFTLDEKIKLITAKNGWETEDFDGRLYKAVVSDGPLGLRTHFWNEEKNCRDTIPAVAFPSATVLAQSFNTSLAYKMGEMLADECIERDVDILLAPGVNVKRLPHCGRNFEYMSEDPYLSGIFGREYIKGVQEHHIGTSLKHYCANNQEYQRHWQSSEVDERTLREIYTYNFKIALEAKPWTVMSSYNIVNGVRMSEHKKLYDMLRDELGFDGLIMSDWDAVKNHAASVKGTLDIRMPYRSGAFEELKAAYECGELTEAEIDRAASKVLWLIEKCESEKALRKVSSSLDERYSAAEKVAEEGIVLLKNNGVLPIADGKSIAIAGRAVDMNISGDGSSRVVPGREIKKLDTLLSALLPSSEICALWHEVRYENTVKSLETVNRSDVAIVLAEQIDEENTDRFSIRLDPMEEQRILDVAKQNKNTVVVLLCGSVIDVSAFEDKVAAIIYAGYPGAEGNAALAKILSGTVSPSGKLTETWPITAEDCLATRCYRDSMHSIYSDGLLVGYRWYDTAKHIMDKADEARVRYPFGHGLSYTGFEYSGLSLTVEDDNIKVEFDVKNTGNMTSSESAQIYFRKPISAVFRPYKELCGFEKEKIGAGETKHYSVTVPKEYLAYYSTAFDKWVIENGDYNILVGASAEDIRLEGRVTI